MDTILQLKISLRGTKPAIWRRVLVEKTATFEALHDVVQIAMGWTNSHLHEFTVNGVRIGQPLDEFDADFGEGLIDAATVTLESALASINQKFDYTYDFGDSWDHVIMVEKWLPGDTSPLYPVCTGGKQKCPPENCGGIPGFYEMLHTLSDKPLIERKCWNGWVVPMTRKRSTSRRSTSS